MKRGLIISTITSILFLTACSQQSSQSEKASTIDSETSKNKVVVYQMMTRLFGNTSTVNKKYGSMEENGVGKFSDISQKALDELSAMGITHVWYTGVIEHATMTDFTAYNIPLDDPDVIKGRAGSPYAIKDYYDINPFLADDPSKRMEEFEALVKRTHDTGLKVIIDFVPNHVARSYSSDAKPDGVEDFGQSDDITSAFAVNNNFYYLPGQGFQVPEDYDPIPGVDHPAKDGSFEENPAKASGNDVFTANPSIHDWFETIKLNYGVDYQNDRTKYLDSVPDTWLKMKDILSYWANKGVDGFRCDMAEMVPVEFWEWVVPEIKKVNKEIIFIAEIYNPAAYVEYIKKGKFDYLYDKVQLYDTVRHIMQDHGLTGNIPAIMDFFNKETQIDAHMLRFLENHDEQRLASSEFARDMQMGIPGMAVSTFITNGPIMIYYGQEVGEPGLGEEGFQGDDGRTTIFDYWGVPEHQKWMNEGAFDGGKLSSAQKSLREEYVFMLNACNTHEAFNNGNYEDLHLLNKTSEIGYKDEKVYAFLRYTGNEKIVVISNFHREASFNSFVKVPDEILQLTGDSKLHNLRSGKTEDWAVDVEGNQFQAEVGPMSYLVIKIENGV